MIEYEINRADLAFVQRKLKGLEGETPKVLKNALNKTAKEARRKLAEGAQSAYTVKIGGFNRHMKIQAATLAKLETVIRSNGKPLTVKSFSNRGGKNKRGGAAAAADIVKSGLKQIISGTSGNKAFKPSGGNIKGLVVQREGAGREPIKVLHSNSVPKMLEKVYDGERGINRALKKTITEGLHRNIEAEIAKLT